MAEPEKSKTGEWETGQAIRALKKGTYLLKYGRRGKPKFCPFYLSNDEACLIWFDGNKEKQLMLNRVSKIIPGQSTAVFQRYPQPEKEYQSFSLIYGSRSLDLICKDKDEAEVWLVALMSLISHGNFHNWESDTSCSDLSSKRPSRQLRKGSACSVSSGLSCAIHKNSKGTQLVLGPSENPPRSRWVQALNDVISLTGRQKSCSLTNSEAKSINRLSNEAYDDSQGDHSAVPCNASGHRSTASDDPSGCSSTISDYLSRHNSASSDNLGGCNLSISDNPNGHRPFSSANPRGRCFTSSNNPSSCNFPIPDHPNGWSPLVSKNRDRNSSLDLSRVSLSSALSSSSQGSSLLEDLDFFGDIFIWGEGTEVGPLGGSVPRDGNYSPQRINFLPKALESRQVLDTQSIACGSKHAVLLSKQGQIYSWGDGTGGRLGHGVEADVYHPKLIDAFSGFNVELVACSQYHTCAVTLSGDLYTWGDGVHNLGLLGHGSEASHCVPVKVSGQIEGLRVSSVSCGPWHTAAIISSGDLFTFGDGSFGALGHGDRCSTLMPREVETLKGLRTLRASCGSWHTAAIVDVAARTSDEPTSGRLFTWGNGDRGQLGHGDKESRLVPFCVAMSEDISFCQVACGNSITITLTASGQVYSMGSTHYGQHKSPESNSKLPTCINDNIKNCYIEEISCGSQHVAILSSNYEVYTWGKGANGQLGHGDNTDRNVPTLVEALKNKQVKSVVCGSNFTAAICLQNWVSSVDHSMCAACHNQFNFRKRRHNCYNCGLAFCHACSSKKSLRAALALNVNKHCRVCDSCFTKLNKAMEPGCISELSRSPHQISNEVSEKDNASKLRRRLSRIFSLGSPTESERWKQRSENNQGDSRSDLVYYDKFSTSVPVPRITSRPPSFSRNSSPTCPVTGTSSVGSTIITEPILEGSKQTNSDFIQETSMLRAQVEDLLHKTHLQDEELKRTYKQLKEATEMAKEEAEKNKVGMEVIRSLVTQLLGSTSNSPSASSFPLSSGSYLLIPSYLEHESYNKILVRNWLNGTNEASENHWVVKDRPGVYATLSSLPEGDICFRQAQFSQKHYNEERAGRWWEENKAEVFKRYNVQTTE